MTPPNATPTTISGDKNREGKPETVVDVLARDVCAGLRANRVMGMREAEFWKLVRGVDGR